jgi:hypothetical protein
MPLQLKSARHAFIRNDNDEEVPYIGKVMPMLSTPHLILAFEDGREARIHPENQIGYLYLELGMDDFVEEVVKIAEGDSELMMRGATDDRVMLQLAHQFLAQVNGRKFKAGPVKIPNPLYLFKVSETSVHHIVVAEDEGEAIFITLKEYYEKSKENPEDGKLLAVRYADDKELGINLDDGAEGKQRKTAKEWVLFAGKGYFACSEY